MFSVGYVSRQSKIFESQGWQGHLVVIICTFLIISDVQHCFTCFCSLSPFCDVPDKFFEGPFVDSSFFLINLQTFWMEAVLPLISLQIISPILCVLLAFLTVSIEDVGEQNLPPKMSLGHADYVELKTIKTQKTQGETCTFPITA